MKDLKERFDLTFSQLNIPKNSNFLVAVSGGIDSMVLCDFFLKSDFQFSVAHCNFQLRNNDSEEDENFVRNYCKEHGITFYTKKFDVKSFKDSGNFSTQMAARELRYKWFEELKKENNLGYLVTAHHLNDSFETFLINLSRGTGIQGLTGIQNHSEKILRPFWNFSKLEIQSYADSKGIKWREDSSNSKSDYVRNKIRNQITPILQEVHPTFLENFAKTIEFLNEDKQIIKNHLVETENRIFQKDKDLILIEIEELKKLSPISTYLFYLFQKFGFKHPFEIEKLLVSEKNGEIQSSSHRLIKNRKEFIIKEIDLNPEITEIRIPKNGIIQKPLYLKLSNSNEREKDAVEILDSTKISFPLILRRSKNGDVIHPLGMKGKKKLSKFFKDEKYSKLEKENTWLLADDKGEILYVIGKRIDNRFKITEHTQNFLNIYL